MVRKISISPNQGYDPPKNRRVKPSPVIQEENYKMHDLRSIHIPKIVDDSLFEHLCRDLWKSDKKNELVNINGRNGQFQAGVDVFGRIIENGEWFGIQCKVRKTNQYLTTEEIFDEIEKAKMFNPTISEYILCTTLDRDAKFQELERNICDELKAQGSFRFKIMSWNDIEEALKGEVNFNVYFKYYQKYFVDNTALGHSVGKLMNLDLGVDGKTDTHYEIMLGKIPNFEGKKHTNANYYRGTYYIVNFHERRMETFTLPCHTMDLITAVSNEFDRFRITKWINTIKDLDTFIFDDENDVEMSITKEVRDKFLERFEEETQ